MYDTVSCTVEHFEPIDESWFEGGQVTTRGHVGEVVRLWFNPKDANLPRVTYWRRVKQSVYGTLRFEFSVPKLAGIDPLANVTQSDAGVALHRATEFARERFHKALPDVGEWACNRVDYAWNWQVGDDLPLYMSVLQGLHAPGMTRHSYPQSDGAVWKSRRDNTRWLKFYNKSLLERDKRPGVLRFEVSNYRRAVAYMCKRWFDCERTVEQVLRPGRFLYTMAVMWERLGLASAQVYRGDQGTLLLRLHQCFGAGAPGAYYALTAIRMYGADAHRVYGLLSPNTYYKWKRELTEQQFMIDSPTHDLAPLHLPCTDVMHDVSASAGPQDLRNFPTGAINSDRKNPRISGWAALAKNLGVIAPVESKYLLGRFAVASGAGD